MKFYHVTYAENIPSIMQNGLQVKCSGFHGYKHRPCVFLSKEKIQAEEFAKCLVGRLAVVVVNLPNNWELTEHPIYFGTVSLKDIPAKYITAIRYSAPKKVVWRRKRSNNDNTRTTCTT